MGIRQNHRPRLRPRPCLVRKEQHNLHFPDGSHLRRHRPHPQRLPSHPSRRPNTIHRLRGSDAHPTGSIPLPSTPAAAGRLQPTDSHRISSSSPPARPPVLTTPSSSSSPSPWLSPSTPTTTSTPSPRLAGGSCLPWTGASHPACSVGRSAQYRASTCVI